MGELINILIRTSNRPQSFQRCIESVFAQHYRNFRIIISYDTEEIPLYLKKLMRGNAEREDRYDILLKRVVPEKNHPYYWNLYCNDLKDEVGLGWFFYLDDDDFLCSDYALDNLATILDAKERAYIVQFDRCGTIKPSDEYINIQRVERGKIGMPCIILHHDIKDLVNFDGEKGADYRFIKAVVEQTPVVFLKFVLVCCDNKGLLGEMES